MIWFLACATSEDPAYTLESLQQDIDGYEEWAQPEGWAGAVPSCDGSHGPFVEIWYNKVALAADGASEMPEGAAFVMKVYADASETLAGSVAQRKVPGFAPERGDWFWGEFDVQDTALSSGDVAACAECHSSGSDFLKYPQSVAVQAPADCP